MEHSKSLLKIKGLLTSSMKQMKSEELREWSQLQRASSSTLLSWPNRFKRHKKIKTNNRTSLMTKFRFSWSLTAWVILEGLIGVLFPRRSRMLSLAKSRNHKRSFFPSIWTRLSRISCTALTRSTRAQTNSRCCLSLGTWPGKTSSLTLEISSSIRNNTT